MSYRSWVMGYRSYCHWMMSYSISLHCSVVTDLLLVVADWSMVSVHSYWNNGWLFISDNWSYMCIIINNWSIGVDNWCVVIDDRCIIINDRTICVDNRCIVINDRSIGVDNRCIGVKNWSNCHWNDLRLLVSSSMSPMNLLVNNWYRGRTIRISCVDNWNSWCDDCMCMSYRVNCNLRLRVHVMGCSWSQVTAESIVICIVIIYYQVAIRGHITVLPLDNVASIVRPLLFL